MYECRSIVQLKSKHFLTWSILTFEKEIPPFDRRLSVGGCPPAIVRRRMSSGEFRLDWCLLSYRSILGTSALWCPVLSSKGSSALVVPILSPPWFRASFWSALAYGCHVSRNETQVHFGISGCIRGRARSRNRTTNQSWAVGCKSFGVAYDHRSATWWLDLA